MCAFCEEATRIQYLLDASNGVRAGHRPYPYDGVVVDRCPIVVQHHKFTGKERDTESGLDDFDARHYSSAIRRFHQLKIVGVKAISANNPREAPYNMATRRASHDSLSLRVAVAFSPAETRLVVSVDCPICPPVGTHDGISARVSTQSQYDCPAILMFFIGITGRGVWNPACQLPLLKCGSAQCRPTQS